MTAAPKTLKRRSIHSGRLERWLGKEKIASLADNMRNGGGPGVRWYWKPIDLLDIPGNVAVTADGDFVGSFERGFFDSAADSIYRHARNLWKAAGKPVYAPEPAFGVGFASISDALSKASSGYGQSRNVTKTGPTGVTGTTASIWRLGANPVAGAIGAAAPGGTVHTSSDTGALAFTNPSTGTLHLTGADMSCGTASNAVMLYDRLFSVAKTMNSTATEAVTGVPTRYQSTTSTAMDYIGGNFLTIFVGGTALAATAHNWTVCTYTNQANTGATLPSITGVSGQIVDVSDLGTGRWFAPLAAGDVGIKALTQMQCSALVATGVIEFVIGHPIGIMAFPIGTMSTPFDWLTNRQQTPRIFDNACLAFMEMNKPAATAVNYNGLIYTCNAP